MLVYLQGIWQNLVKKNWKTGALGNSVELCAQKNYEHREKRINVEETKQNEEIEKKLA